MVDSKSGPPWTKGFKQRLQSDFQFAMIVAFGTLVMVAVSGFAVFRLFTGDIFGALVNAAIVVLVAVIIGFSILFSNSRLAGLLFALATALGVAASALVFGSTALFWAHLVMWMNFVLTDRRWAVFINLVVVIVVITAPGIFDARLAIVTFLVTAFLISAFGYIFAWRLGNQQAQLEQIASRDPLTGVGNRRSMRKDLESAISDYRLTDRPYTLLLLDLDHFKVLNDQHGHDAGDQALCAFSELLRASIRSGDSVYRFGGEEFVILFRNTGVQGAERIARGLHETTSGAVLGAAGQIRFSAGVAVLQPGEDINSWLRRADRALYQAKQQGRDRLEISSVG